MDKTKVITSPFAQYAARTLDRKVLFRAASGGVFAELAKFVIRNGGVAVGAAWVSDPLRVQHIGVGTYEDISMLQGVKYVQSDMQLSYSIVGRALRNNRMVLFSGTPCQTMAIRKNFGANPRLILCAILCHGIPTLESWTSYIKELEGQYGSEIIGYSFRDKVSGWRASVTSAQFRNGEKLTIPNARDAYYRAFISGISVKSCCTNCPAKLFSSGADIMIGDCWGVENLCRNFTDDLGVSVVVALSSHGAEILDKLDVEKYWIPFEGICRYNPVIYKSMSVDLGRREAFLREYPIIGFHRAVSKFLDESIFKKIKRRMFGALIKRRK